MITRYKLTHLFGAVVGRELREDPVCDAVGILRLLPQDVLEEEQVVLSDCVPPVAEGRNLKQLDRLDQPSIRDVNGRLDLFLQKGPEARSRLG